MANTKSLIGEKATLQGLIDHTLETFEDDSITNTKNFFLSRNNGIKSVNLPNATQIGTYFG